MRSSSRSIVILPTQECNLRCKYCYVEKKPGVLKMSTLNKFLEFLDYVDYFANAESISCLFLGGEPLLYPKTVAKIIDILRKKYPGIELILETNLTLFNSDIKKLFLDPGIDITPSIDGIQATHDSSRRRLDGRSSYQEVISNLKQLVKCQNRIPVVYTFPSSARELRMVEFIKALKAIGPNTKWEVDIRPELGEIHNPEFIAEEYMKLAKFIAEDFKHSQSNFEIVMFNKWLRAEWSKKQGLPQAICGVGATELTLMPDGELWPCPGYYHKRKRRLGNLNEGDFATLKTQLLGLRLLLLGAIRKYKNMQCQCPGNDICPKLLCLAELEHNSFQCRGFYPQLMNITLSAVNALKKNLGETYLKQYIHRVIKNEAQAKDCI